MFIFENWLYKIEKVSFYGKININFTKIVKFIIGRSNQDRPHPFYLMHCCQTRLRQLALNRMSFVWNVNPPKKSSLCKLRLKNL